VRATVGGKAARLPDFLVVGTARSGTTSIYNYLKGHPEVFIPEMKESYFLAYGGEVSEFSHHKTPVVTTLEDYASLFEPAGGGKLLGEVSASYLYLHESTIPNIRKYLPGWQDLKIVIVLREPVERAYSMYKAFVRWEEEPLRFEEALESIPERMRENWHPEYDYLGYGFYYEQVKAYMDNFPDVKVLLYDDLKRDPRGFMEDLAVFLGAAGAAASGAGGERYNPSEVPFSWRLHQWLKKPDLVSSVFPFVKIIPLEKRIEWTQRLKSLNVGRRLRMKPRTRRRLKALYRDDVMRLQGLIGRDLSAWLKP
jgi:hypothetical protein